MKHTGAMPIIGVNTFRDPDAHDDELSESVELARATEEEKVSQLNRLADFHSPPRPNRRRRSSGSSRSLCRAAISSPS